VPPEVFVVEPEVEVLPPATVIVTVVLAVPTPEEL